jgi:hypothetical protein
MQKKYHTSQSTSMISILVQQGSLWIISGACAVLLIVHLAIRFWYGTVRDGFDTVALILVIVGLSPWIGHIIETLSFAGVQFKFRQLQDKVKEQGIEIDQLKLLIAHFLPYWEVEHMKNLLKKEPFWIDLDNAPASFESELRHLRWLKLIDPIGGCDGVTDFLMSEPRQKDLCNYFEVTKAGIKYLEYREKASDVTE